MISVIIDTFLFRCKQGGSLKQGEIIHGLGFCKLSSTEGQKELGGGGLYRGALC